MFGAAAVVPALIVLVLAWRARGAAIVDARRDEDVRAAAVASSARRELEARVAEARAAVLRSAEEGDVPVVPPAGAEAVVLDAAGDLVFPERAPIDGAASAECLAARDKLIGPERAPSVATILASCVDLKTVSGVYLWPLLAIEANAPGLPLWLERHAQRLSSVERDVLRRRAGSLEPVVRDHVIASLAGTASAGARMIEVLEDRADERVEGPLLVRRGEGIVILRVLADGRRRGVVFHEESILRSPPVLPAEFVLARGSGGADVSVALTPRLTFHVTPRDPAAQSRQIARAGDWLVGVAGGVVAVSIALAALIHARFLRARRLADLRTDFVAAVSHELRTPLASVQMFAELLEQGAVPESEREEVERMLAGEARRLSDTLSRMLRFGALARGKLVVEKQATELAFVAADAASRFARVHAGTPLDVEVEPGLSAEVDAGLVGLVLDNLLGNAAKYAPLGAPYRVRMYHARERVVISVADSGPGLEPAAQSRIFLPFERVDDRLSRATEGTGVGLALVRGIAEAHGGRARVESTPGKGSTFFVELPWKPS